MTDADDDQCAEEDGYRKNGRGWQYRLSLPLLFSRTIKWRHALYPIIHKQIMRFVAQSIKIFFLEDKALTIIIR